MGALQRWVREARRAWWRWRGDRRGLKRDSREDGPIPSGLMQWPYYCAITFGDLEGPYALHDTISWWVDRAWTCEAARLRPTVQRLSRAGREATFWRDNGSAVRVALTDHYVGELVTRLAELETERYALDTLCGLLALPLGRKTDELIIDALAQSPHTVGDPTEGMTGEKALAALDLLGARRAPDVRGDWFVVVSWSQWQRLLDVPDFDAAPWRRLQLSPYVWAETSGKRWLGALWIGHGGLPISDGVRTCFVYHRSAVGHAIGDGVVTDITWDADRAAHRVTCTLSQGAALIEPDAVVKIPCRETLP